MRHNAIVTFLLEIPGPDHEPLERKFTFYTRGGCEQPAMREHFRKALRSKRRLVMQDPEQVIVSVLARFALDMNFFLYRRDSEYAWRYTFDLRSHVPRLRIRHPAGDTTQSGLFAWIGSERRTIPHDPLNPRVPRIGQRRRGRPSNLQTDPRISDAKRAEMRAELQQLLKK